MSGFATMTKEEKKEMSLTQTQHNNAVVEALTANPDLIKNKVWRMNNLYFIVTKDGKKEVFAMNRAQRHFFENYLT
jgi:hypothetical protein